MDPINEIQELNLRLIELSSFNAFDGEKVVKDLRAYKHLWKAVLMTEDNGRLIRLRDLHRYMWCVSTVFILPNPEKEQELFELAHSWSPDECDWIEGKEACKLLGSYGTGQKILRAWWD